eukprot:11066907-Prorocentrum_lima.AAC.1
MAWFLEGNPAWRLAAHRWILAWALARLVGGGVVKAVSASPTSASDGGDAPSELLRGLGDGSSEADSDLSA